MAINKRVRMDGSVGYQVVVDEYDPITRKRTRHTVGTFPDLKQAKKEHAKAIATLDSGEFVERSALTVGEVIEIWIDSKRRSIRGSSISLYESMLKNYIRPSLGAVPVQSLTPLMVQRAVNGWTKNGSHYATAGSAYRVLASAMNYAVRIKIVGSSPCAGVVVPKNPSPTERTIWNEQEVSRFLKVAEDHAVSVLWFLLLETGVRRGEALGLHWEDVDWEGSSIRIASIAVQDRPSSRMKIQAMPKTDSSRRVVLVSDGLLKRLRLWRKQNTDSLLVFPEPDGLPLKGAYVLDELARLCEAAAVRRVTIHELRHISATRMMRAGVSMIVAQQRMGHSSIEMLRKVYAHADADLQREAVERIARLG